jgi:hypothetical protein
MEIECPGDISWKNFYNIFQPINLGKSNTIISNIDRIINTHKNLKVLNYSKAQTTELLNLSEPSILTLAANFPQNKFLIINEKIQNGKKIYSLFIILDIVKRNNSSMNSIKDQSKINKFILNNVSQYCNNIS